LQREIREITASTSLFGTIFTRNMMKYMSSGNYTRNSV
jgi:hypothetical protein